MLAISGQISGCFPQPVGLEGNLIRGHSAKSLVGSTTVVEVEVSAQARPCLRHAVVCPQVNFFVLDRTPQPLDAHIVHPASLAIHADACPRALPRIREPLARELASLIGVEDLRRAKVGQRFLQGFYTEIRGHGIGQPPRQHPTAMPVQNRYQIYKPAHHRNVADVRRPHLVRPIDRQPTQQVRVDLVTRRRDRRPRFPMHRPDAHPTHQATHPVAARHHSVAPSQLVPQAPGTHPRVLQVQLVQQSHHRQIRRRLPGWPVATRRAGQIQQLALPCDAQIPGRLDHFLAFGPRALPNARDKKFFSSVSYPILACSSLRSASVACEPAPLSKAAARFSIACCFHCTIWLACTSNCSDSSASVLSPRILANATLALNCVEWFRLGLLIGLSRRLCAKNTDGSFTDPPIQLSQAGSVRSKRQNAFARPIIY